MFDMSPQEIQEKRCGFTAAEIDQQPETWQKTLDLLRPILPELRQWTEKTVGSPDFDVIFTGAGTSEFTGNALYHSLNPMLGFHVRSYSSTALVAAPQYYLSRKKPTLLVSFARSGNSPESVGAVAAANVYCKNLQHLFITCNQNGTLAQIAEDQENCRCVVLPEETNDRGFAMTSSFTNMYLAAFCILSGLSLNKIQNLMNSVIEGGRKFLDDGFRQIRELVDRFAFDRLVYLGTGPLNGFAQEASLKVLELTAGKVVPLFESPMGFRHGPKSILNEKTLTVFFFSGRSSTRRYELDLLDEMRTQHRNNPVLVLSGQPDPGAEKRCDVFLCFDNPAQLPDAFLGLEYILAAQTLALFKSMSLQIGPDNPCPTGEVNRVVKGVVLYPVEK